MNSHVPFSALEKLRITGTRKSFLVYIHCLNSAAPSSHSLDLISECAEGKFKPHKDKCWQVQDQIMVDIVTLLTPKHQRKSYCFVILNARLTNKKNNCNLQNLVYLYSKGYKPLQMFFPRSSWRLYVVWMREIASHVVQPPVLEFHWRSFSLLSGKYVALRSLLFCMCLILLWLAFANVEQNHLIAINCFRKLWSIDVMNWWITPRIISNLM